MAPVQTHQEVTVEDVRSALSDALGPRFRVNVTSETTLNVGRTGVIPVHVRMRRTDGRTTFTLRTTGLIVSRVAQAVTVCPQVRRALLDSFGNRSV